MVFQLAGPCPDSGLQNVQNRAAMTPAGWILDVDPDTTNYAGHCGSSTFWGYKVGAPIGRVSAVFKGFGSATLNFGMCYVGGTTKVYLNNLLIGSAAANQKSVGLVPFNYKPGDTLKLEEEGGGIIIINSLQIACGGKKKRYSRLFSENMIKTIFLLRFEQRHPMDASVRPRLINHGQKGFVVSSARLELALMFLVREREYKGVLLWGGGPSCIFRHALSC